LVPIPIEEAMLTLIVPPQTAAILAATGFLVIAASQVALAFGAPLGRAAWGGKQGGRLPRNLRIASAVAAAVWLPAALVVLNRAGIPLVPLPELVAFWGSWLLVVVLPIGAIMNFASSSPYERFGWGPLALLLAALTLLVAIS
jgi:hypothetical protein